jgi:hypothetical protein
MPVLPALIVVSGPMGSGKTTLAHRIAQAVGCPAICRDEIKEGMVQATPEFAPRPGDGTDPAHPGGVLRRAGTVAGRRGDDGGGGGLAFASQGDG